MRLARLAIVLVAAAAAACGACGTSAPGPGPGASSAGSRDGSDGPEPRASGAGDASTPAIERALWAHAKDGTEEDLATLATHEGAAGLVEAATEDEALRPTAIRAMAYAEGWAQLPYLVKVASAKDDGDAKLALDAVVDLATRPRRQTDVEDEEELREGCEGLLALAKDKERPRERRVRAIRALRMMPCPKAELPTDVDTR